MRLKNFVGPSVDHGRHAGRGGSQALLRKRGAQRGVRSKRGPWRGGPPEGGPGAEGHGLESSPQPQTPFDRRRTPEAASQAARGHLPGLPGLAHLCRTPHLRACRSKRLTLPAWGEAVEPRPKAPCLWPDQEGATVAPQEQRREGDMRGASPGWSEHTRHAAPPNPQSRSLPPALPGRTRVLRPHSATRQTEEAPGPLGTPLSPMSSSHGAANSGLRPPLPCPWEEFRGIKGAGQSVHRVPETPGPRAEWPRTGPSGPSPPRADVTARTTPALGSVLHLLLHSEPPHRYMLSHPPLTDEET